MPKEDKLKELFDKQIGKSIGRGGQQDICRCPCHNSGGHMKHCMPCCTECPYCRRNIIMTAYQAHIEECKPK